MVRYVLLVSVRMSVRVIPKAELDPSRTDRYQNVKVRTPEQNQRRLQAVPMKRMATAEEVANLTLFLLSDESGYITGAEVAIEDGATL
jgi:NAD(P)-dependent dehydrogenase (short-subunit alcohol dehydrogenase family)